MIPASEYRSLLEVSGYGSHGSFGLKMQVAGTGITSDLLDDRSIRMTVADAHRLIARHFRPELSSTR